MYCPAGDFYIDPVRAVSHAVITHGHADHARGGHQLGRRRSLLAAALAGQVGGGVLYEVIEVKPGALAGRDLRPAPALGQSARDVATAEQADVHRRRQIRTG